MLQVRMFALMRPEAVVVGKQLFAYPADVVRVGRRVDMGSAIWTLPHLWCIFSGSYGVWDCQWLLNWIGVRVLWREGIGGDVPLLSFSASRIFISWFFFDSKHVSHGPNIVVGHGEVTQCLVWRKLDIRAGVIITKKCT